MGQKQHKKRKKLTKTTAMHYVKLVLRSCLFIGALVFYIINRIHGWSLDFITFGLKDWIFAIVWLSFFVEMMLRFFPSSIESMGCQKIFKKNYRPAGAKNAHLNTWKSTLMVALSWLLLNAVFGVLYFVKVFDVGILVLISLLFSVCDLICILFFCPFQTWMMKNKCCGTCRIYNWDFAMMFTPLVFVPSLYTWTLLGLSLLLLIRWEVGVRMHPERFMEKTNACLSCSNCKEKLCQHKTQLAAFLKKHKELLQVSVNANKKVDEE